MGKCAGYIKSFRLRTLPLSVAGIVLGSLLAASAGSFDTCVFVLAVATTLCLQILSNISNELGDYLHGTDGEQRRGPQYAISSGALGVKEMKRAIAVFVVLACLLGVWLVAESFDKLLSTDGLVMIVAGGAAVLAALGYTLGKHPYGYAGFGDAAVFVFFGLLAVAGSFFLMTGRLSWSVVLPAAACGALSVGVLNVNNTRDMESDRATRRTVPLMIGLRGTKIYQAVLVAVAFGCLSAYCIVTESATECYLFWVLAPLFVWHIVMFCRSEGRQLDRQLPLLSVATLLLCILFGVMQAI